MKYVSSVLSVVLLASICAAQVAPEAAEKAYSAGLKIWTVDGDAGDGTLLGPTITAHVGDDMFASALFVSGDVGDSGYDASITDSEFLFGKELEYVDIGAGLKFVEGSDAGDSASGYGIMLYAGTGNLFKEGPLGWYLAGTFTPEVWGDLGDAGVGPVYTVEGGLYAAWPDWTAALGYRLLDETDGDMKYDGLSLTGSFRF
jgi:hypothetical protein